MTEDLFPTEQEEVPLREKPAAPRPSSISELNVDNGKRTTLGLQLTTQKSGGSWIRKDGDDIDHTQSAGKTRLRETNMPTQHATDGKT